MTAAQTLRLYTDLVCQSLGRRYPRARKPLARVSATAGRLTQRLQPPPEVPAIPKENIKFFRRTGGQNRVPAV